jgi:hypothetical protein
VACHLYYFSFFLSENLDELQSERWLVGDCDSSFLWPANTIIVVTMLITNSDGLPPSTFDSVYKAAGVDTMSYTPASASQPASGWPTLGSLIDGGTRLVTFLAQQADFTQVPYLIDGTFAAGICICCSLFSRSLHRVLKCVGDCVRCDGYYV